MSGQIPLLKKISAHVMCIELRRPDSANRLELEDLIEIQSLVGRCESDIEIRVLIFTSQGKYFSAGLDFGVLKNLNNKQTIGAGSGSELERTANLIAKTKLITIASIQGPIFGGATDIALACDLRIGNHDTFLQMPAAKIGLPLYASAIERYVSNFGLSQAKRLILTCVSVPAEELLQIGFLTELVAKDDLEEKTFQVAQMVSEFPFQPVSAMKKYLNSTASIDKSDWERSKQELLNSFDGVKISERIDIKHQK